MMEANADRLVDLFHEAKARPAGPERARFLFETCHGDPELREQVLSLLQAHEEAEGFLDCRPAHFQPEAAAEKPGDKLGHYRLLEQIGVGGCGVVYLAEQEEPVHRQVALKIIKLGMDTRAVVARFEAERQALALMDHPSIARVFEAGATGTGRPYFVMELVRGMRITDYCEKARAPMEQRLRLIIQVCQAVQHAHQKGIIHRDLKPSNVLVRLQDGLPVPKVIDFGIAKATSNQRLTDHTLFTAFEQFIGTPAYMSPEQAGMSGDDIDTRSDIYSLGVLLYELLTGTTPFPQKRLRGLGYNEMQRIIIEEEPERPSTRLSTLRGERGSVAVKNRGASELTLTRDFPGDLDWIVMKCLEKDRARRYASASGLAADIQRHLNNEPVTARPPGRVYKLQKLVRRNRLAVGAASALLATLVFGIAGSTWQAVRATRAESDLAHQLYVANLRGVRHAWDENNTRLVRELLEQTAGNPERGIEWYYWQQQTHLELKTLRGHLGPVVAVNFSPDSQRIVTGSYDQTAKVWDANGTELATLSGHRREVLSVAFSPDGTRIATGSADRTARIWKTVSGQQLFNLQGHTGWVTSVVFSPDGRRIVTGSFDGTVRFWDAASGNMVHLLNQTGAVWTVAFSSDSRFLLTGSGDKAATLWDAATFQRLYRIEAPRTFQEGDLLAPYVNLPFTASFSPKDQWIVTASRDQTTTVWDMATHQSLFSLKGSPHWMSPMQGGIPFSAAFFPDGRRLVMGGLDYTAAIWDVAERTNLLFTLKGHSAEITSVAVSPDGRLVLTGSFDHCAKVWDGMKSRQSLALQGHTNVIPTAEFSLDGQRVVTGSWDGTARIWEAASGKMILTLDHGKNQLWAVAFSPDGQRVVTGGVQGMARVWDASTGNELFALKGHKGDVVSVVFFPDGKRIVTGASDGAAMVWDANTGDHLFSLVERDSDYCVVHAVVSPDGQRIVTVTEAVPYSAEGLRILNDRADGILSNLYEGSAHVWDASSGTRLFPLAGHTGGITDVAFSPDSQRIVTGSIDKTARVWEAATGRELQSFEGHSDRVVFATFSSDGKQIVTGGFDNTTRVWDAARGEELLTIKNSLALALSPDNRRILSVSESPAEVLEIASVEQVTTWQNEEEAANKRLAVERRKQTTAAERNREPTISER
jgi:WD40 repeat protein/serine/threonine protein kinase